MTSETTSDLTVIDLPMFSNYSFIFSLHEVPPMISANTDKNIFKLFISNNVLPQEIIEWIAAGVDFCDHLVEVSAELVYAYFLTC